MKNKRRLAVFRFNLIEVALALVILAIGLSSVMVLFPVGLKAGRSGVADNNLADVAEQVGSYVQSKISSPEIWKDTGKGKDDDASLGIDKFTADPTDAAIPGDPGEFTADANKIDNVDGLFKHSSKENCFLYRQYSSMGGNGVADADRPVDFEAMVRIGWEVKNDNTSYTLADQYFFGLEDVGNPAQYSGYTRERESARDPFAGDPKLWDTNLPASAKSSDLVELCCRTLVIEISWPADVAWSKREKRIFRLEMFNQNFVPYPRSSAN